jgi:hypothetical protein
MYADKSVVVIDENQFTQPRFLTHLCSALRMQHNGPEFKDISG